MIRYGLPVFAFACFCFALASVQQLRPQELSIDARVVPVSTTMLTNTIAGLGEVQLAGEPIDIATPTGGIVSSTFVEPGQRVSKGQPLFELDKRELLAELRTREIMHACAETKLARLRAGALPIERSIAVSLLESAQVSVDHAKDAWFRVEKLIVGDSITSDDYNARKYNYQKACATLGSAKAELDKVNTGAGQHDIQLAELECESTASSVEQLKVNIERLTIRAPVDGIVLCMNLQVGEFAQAGLSNVQIGADGPLKVRVQIDEEDAGGLSQSLQAEGVLRGRDRIRLPLRLLRIEPKIVPKFSVKNASVERVDSSVLFVVFEIDSSYKSLFAGQKMDVFIKALPETTTIPD